MLDFLFRFNVLNTAIAVIGKEIVYEIYGAGENYILMVWIFICALSQLWQRTSLLLNLHADVAYTWMFLLSSGYSLFSSQVASKSRLLTYCNWKVFRIIARALSMCLLPMMIWSYLWLPLNSATSKVVELAIGTENSAFSFFASIFNMAVILVVLSQGKPTSVNVKSQTSKTMPSDTPLRRRPPSARIQAKLVEDEIKRRTLSRSTRTSFR